ncbi:MAG: hypothetical protein NTW87_01675 [Planctomycetota bacterium]|nr:hypothetical protein [Planctomycetota bacterium]
MRGGPRPNCGRRGLKIVPCRIPVELHDAIACGRRDGETFPQAALRLFAPHAPETSNRQIDTPEARETRG